MKIASKFWYDLDKKKNLLLAIVALVIIEGVYTLAPWQSNGFQPSYYGPHMFANPAGNSLYSTHYAPGLMRDTYSSSFIPAHQSLMMQRLKHAIRHHRLMAQMYEPYLRNVNPLIRPYALQKLKNAHQKCLTRSIYKSLFPKSKKFKKHGKSLLKKRSKKYKKLYKYKNGKRLCKCSKSYKRYKRRGISKHKKRRHNRNRHKKYRKYGRRYSKRYRGRRGHGKRRSGRRGCKRHRSGSFSRQLRNAKSRLRREIALLRKEQVRPITKYCKPCICPRPVYRSPRKIYSSPRPRNVYTPRPRVVYTRPRTVYTPRPKTVYRPRHYTRPATPSRPVVIYRQPAKVVRPPPPPPPPPPKRKHRHRRRRRRRKWWRFWK
jgi:hypothetical protein